MAIGSMMVTVLEFADTVVAFELHLSYSKELRKRGYSLWDVPMTATLII